ncbi:tripartite tricarboxylate transporter substrate binding protein [Acidovorax sp. NCPPB 3859]|nr:MULTISPECIES: tripartite tricarboxylate transporter substrate binding protein [unclassified Acidovorax]MDA8449040.1 tripartite tricarboxylate transporter substrate binding protein [Acidovorax sp. GBBC 3297]MDA8458872.1 tripartite tricarboxylate transporter substrate binding protein [Acidovorax sp. GBBC 3333]MDA8463796.1 tripartite tricarboxylate transporter substrate binding protein [Acidovorax sp. GBBC 3332]MDA8468828.1 tripartite tricarboxylate transporter substrate binding protein [Acidov
MKTIPTIPTIPTINRRHALGSLLLASAAPGLAFAQAARYPTETVRMIVPYAAGGATDIVARAVVDKLGARWGQAVVVENKAGAGTTLAAAQMARAPGDGYQLYMTTSAHVVSALVYPKLSYDPVKDFAPLTLIAKVPLVLVVRPTLEAKTLEEFTRYVRANPEKATFASPGNGTAQHLTGEMFNAAMKTRMLHVPYKGDAPAVTDLLGGSVDAMFATLTVVLPYIASGKLRAIALANGKRVEKVPEIPTFAEQGLRNFEAATWFGVLAPASMPAALRERISGDIRAVVDQPDLRARLIDLGGEVVSSDPAAFSTFMQAEFRKWQDIVKQSGAVIS